MAYANAACGERTASQLRVSALSAKATWTNLDALELELEFSNDGVTLCDITLELFVLLAELGDLGVRPVRGGRRCRGRSDLLGSRRRRHGASDGGGSSCDGGGRRSDWSRSRGRGWGSGGSRSGSGRAVGLCDDGNGCRLLLSFQVDEDGGRRLASEPLRCADRSRGGRCGREDVRLESIGLQEARRRGQRGPAPSRTLPRSPCGAR